MFYWQTFLYNFDDTFTTWLPLLVVCVCSDYCTVVMIRPDMAGEEEDWKRKTRDRGGWKRLSEEAVKKLRAAPHP